MAITLQRPTHVAGFLALARELLAAREAENNLLFGLCDVIASHPEVYPECRFAVAMDGEAAIGAALQTPPHNLVLSTMEPDVAARLVVALGPDAAALPGVLGPTDVVRAFVDASGRAASVAMRERIFRAERVLAPRPAPGSWRLADERDRATLAAWADAFRAEALPGLPNREDGAATADRWLRRAGRTIYVWDGDTGAPVSIAGAGGKTPLGVRIGPVYTPPAHRGRGFASNLVAAVTQQQLSEGRAFCFLFTDLANPTSNKIYQAVGYAPVIDVDQYAFS
jgi:predicted GNAT family acetyltransferase